MNECVDCDHQDLEKEPLGLLGALNSHDSDPLYGGVGPEKRLAWHDFVYDQQRRRECAFTQTTVTMWLIDGKGPSFPQAKVAY